MPIRRTIGCRCCQECTSQSVRTRPELVVTQLAAKRDASVVENWPFNALNALPDQVLLTRLLTAQREKGDPWTRTCLVLRPFHATTNYNKRYSQEKSPVQLILDRKAKDQK